MITISMSDEESDKSKEERQRDKTFNNLTAKEWTQLSRNVWRDLSSQRKDFHKEHGATFSIKLAERLIKMYSGDGDLVFDPFVGTGTTVVAAQKNNLSGVGIELVEDYVEISRDRLEQKSIENYGSDESLTHEIIHDDCLNLKDHLDDDSVQLTITSPPYSDLIHKATEDRETRDYSIIEEENNSTISTYSDKEEDFGNMSYEEYLSKVGKLMEKIYDVTEPGGYNIWIVKDFRDTENDIPYVPLHSDVARMGEKAGFNYHDLIVWDQNQHRRLVLLGYPSVFYTNQNSSFIVVLRKDE